MNKIQSPWLAVKLLITLGILSGLSFSLEARILSVQGTNTPSQLGLTSNARSQVTWAVVEEANARGQAQIRSDEGLFLDPTQENILGRSTRLLSQTRPLVGEMNTTFVFQESLIIPQSVIRSAQSLGLNQIIYRRSFQDTPGETSLANTVTFSISASGLDGHVNLRQIQLEFDDGRTSIIINANSQLKANAIVSYQGTGVINYRWEIASPPTTSGQPIFMPMITRREFLRAGGQATISSDVLPTNLTGNYLLRLNIIQADAQFEMPMLRYVVQADENLSKAVTVDLISITKPANNTKLTHKTQFSWQPVKEAHAYQVEFYSRPIRNETNQNSQQNKPLTGVVVPASQTSLTMGQVSTAHLNIGVTYYWRVIAISEKGNQVGASDFRSINY